MMLGREPFEFVLDICKQAEGVVFFNDKIIAKLPNIEYKSSAISYDSDICQGYDNDSDLYNDVSSDIDIDSDTDSDSDSDDSNYEAPIFGTIIPTKILLIKPISVALASAVTSLDFRSFIPAFLPMLKYVDREMKELNIQDPKKQLKAILEACVNIPNVENGVTIELCSNYNFTKQMKAFAIPCRKLTIKNAYFNYMHHGKKFDNSHLRNIRDLTIEGTSFKTDAFFKNFKEFAAFISLNFPNLETLNINFLFKNGCESYYWDWNDNRMADAFKSLPTDIKGCICFKILNCCLEYIDHVKYPDVHEDSEYFKIFPVTNNLTFKLAYWYDYKVHKGKHSDYSGYSSDYGLGYNYYD
uniref:Uncharacterized protein n=1 Tax=Panagrolaimus sp. ES5 TaxID=591445 RepID=A0AC34FMJ6_9BILA